MICTFFGHRDAPQTIRNTLYDTIVDIIESKGADCFYVGNHGSFDRLVLSVLKEISKTYPQISYNIVYAYLPQNSDEDHLHTIYPEGIEKVPKRFAISFRNKWMIKRADIVVTYVRYSTGNAAKLAEMASKSKKEVINI